MESTAHRWIEQTIGTRVIWDAAALIMTSFQCMQKLVLKESCSILAAAAHLVYENDTT